MECGAIVLPRVTAIIAEGDMKGNAYKLNPREVLAEIETRAEASYSAFCSEVNRNVRPWELVTEENRDRWRKFAEVRMAVVLPGDGRRRRRGMDPGYIGINCPKPDSADNTPVKVLGEKVELTRTRREIWEETVRICETQFNLLLSSGMDWRDAATILPTGTLTVNGRPVALVVGGEGIPGAPDPYEAFAKRMGVRPVSLDIPHPIDGIRPHLPRPDEDPLEERREEIYAGPGPLDPELDQLKTRREELRRSDRETFGPGAKPLDPL